MLQLSQPVRRHYSHRTSRAGWAVILLCMSAMLIFTLFMQARTETCSTVYENDLDNYTADKCGLALLSSGQRLQTPDTAFTYTAVRSTRIGALNLRNCAMVDSASGFRVISAPTSAPPLVWNITYVCNPASKEDATDTYSGFGLNKDSVVLAVEALNFQGAGQPIWEAIKDLNVNMTTVIIDSTYRAQGWEVYLNGDVVYLVNSQAALPYVDYNNDTIAGPFSSAARSLLFTTIAAAIQRDLTTALSPVPDLTYPCTQCSVSWKPASAFTVGQIIWSTIVGLAAVYVLAKLLAEVIMSRMEPNPDLPSYLNKSPTRPKGSSFSLNLRPLRSPAFAPSYDPDAPPYASPITMSDIDGPYMQIGEAEKKHHR